MTIKQVISECYVTELLKTTDHLLSNFLRLGLCVLFRYKLRRRFYVFFFSSGDFSPFDEPEDSCLHFGHFSALSENSKLHFGHLIKVRAMDILFT